MNSLTLRILAALLLLVLISGCASTDIPQKIYATHTTRALGGYYPYIGPDIRVPARTNDITKVRFPLRVSAVYFVPGAPIRLAKKYDHLWVQANDDLKTGGVEVTVRLIDGKEYKLRIRPADPREELYVRVGFDNMIREPHIPNHGADYRRASYSWKTQNVSAQGTSQLMRALQTRTAYRSGYEKMEGAKGRPMINTPEMSAVVADAYVTDSLVGYVVKVSNRTDKPIQLRESTFSNYRTLATHIENPRLAPSQPTFQTTASTKGINGTFVYLVQQR